MPFVHVNHEGHWFICDLPEGFSNAGYAYVEISDEEYNDYNHMLEEFGRWQDKLEKYATEGGKHHPFTRYFVDGVEHVSE